MCMWSIISSFFYFFNAILIPQVRCINKIIQESLHCWLVIPFPIPLPNSIPEGSLCHITHRYSQIPYLYYIVYWKCKTFRIIILHLYSLKKQLLKVERDAKWHSLKMFLFIQLTPFWCDTYWQGCVVNSTSLTAISPTDQ